MNHIPRIFVALALLAALVVAPRAARGQNRPMYQRLADLPVVDVRSKQAKPNDGVDDRAAIAAAATAAGSGAIAVPPGTFRVSTSVTIACGVTMATGAILDVDAGAVVTINGPFDARIARHFSGAGTVTFGNGYVDRVYPQWWGAVSSDSLSDSAAIQSAIAAAKSAPVGMRGGTVYFSPGIWNIDTPIILPRTGVTPAGAVWLIGAGERAARITGMATFPANRGMIEWDPTLVGGSAICWHQRIEGLCLLLPDVAGVNGIKHSPTIDLSNPALVYTDMINQWLQLDLENLLIEGSNTYHEVLINLGVGARVSTWRNIYGDPARGPNPIYATLLIRTPTQWKGADAPHGEDSVGIGLSTVSHCYSMIRRGGWTRLFEGRMYDTTFHDTFDQGSTSTQQGGITQYGYHFINSFSCSLKDLGAEGHAQENLYRFTRCRDMQIENIIAPMMTVAHPAWTAGTPYAAGAMISQTALINATGTATNRRYLICTTPGTSGGTEPVCPPTPGDTVNDGSVVWTASTDNALGDASIYFEDCRNVALRGRFASPSNPTASSRLSKELIIDANCKFVRCEDFSSRGLVVASVADASTDAATQISVLSPPENFNFVTGSLVQSFGNWTLPYRLGNDHLRPRATATLDFPSVASLGSQTLTVTVASARVGDVVHITPPSGFPATLTLQGYVTSDNTVTARAGNPTAGAIDPPSGSFPVALVK